MFSGRFRAARLWAASTVSNTAFTPSTRISRYLLILQRLASAVNPGMFMTHLHLAPSLTVVIRGHLGNKERKLLGYVVACTKLLHKIGIAVGIAGRFYMPAHYAIANSPYARSTLTTSIALITMAFVMVTMEIAPATRT